MSQENGAIVARHTGVVLLGAFIGWLYGSPAAGIAVAAVAALAWHLSNLLKLHHWLYAENEPAGTSGSGIWADICARITYFRTTAERSKERYRRLSAEWRAITNALPDAGLLLNANLEIIEYNTSARDMLRLEDASDRGQRITNILRNPNLVEAFEQENFAEPVVIMPTRAPGRFYSCQITRYGDAQYLLLVRDVSERRLTEKIRADFVANASHELRTPLTVLGGYLDSLQDDSELEEHWHSPVQEMIAQVDRMQALVTDLMRLNQLEVQIDAPRTPVDVHELLDQACNVARQLSEHAAEIRMRCDSTDELLGDPSALRSVVTNLLSNAVRFTPADGRIEARWWVDDDGGHLSVTDSGIGIPDEDIERVTERFYRTDPGRARHDGGTGLGLAIVKHALSMHQANLEVRSTMGSGSTFVCHFPAYRIQASRETAEAQHG